MVVTAIEKSFSELHQRRHIAIMLGPKQQMPTIGHQAIGANSQRGLTARLAQHLLERLEVRRLLEKPHPRDAAVQDVEHHPTSGAPRCAWHRGE
jgi:hypothetical protein